ncbi:hypothetical protein [Winogradskyella sp. A2]|uniref:hypothetical protein n=1 Tax=Winogradskyella sp. A2 TaxID=3366944 RepID=UPI00398C661A
MRHNILGGLVIFMVVVTCLIMIDDISKPKKEEIKQTKTEIEKVEQQNNLAVIDN